MELVNNQRKTRPRSVASAETRRLYRQILLRGSAYIANNYITEVSMGNTTKTRAKLTNSDLKILSKLSVAANKPRSESERRDVEGLCNNR